MQVSPRFVTQLFYLLLGSSMTNHQGDVRQCVAGVPLVGFGPTFQGVSTPRPIPITIFASLIVTVRNFALTVIMCTSNSHTSQLLQLRVPPRRRGNQIRIAADTLANRESNSDIEIYISLLPLELLAKPNPHCCGVKNLKIL